MFEVIFSPTNFSEAQFERLHTVSAQERGCLAAFLSERLSAIQGHTGSILFELF